MVMEMFPTRELGIELEQPCPECKGSGIARRPDIVTGDDRDVICAVCNRTGRVPSEAGKELLAFLNKYAKRSSAGFFDGPAFGEVPRNAAF